MSRAMSRAMIASGIVLGVVIGWIAPSSAGATGTAPPSIPRPEATTPSDETKSEAPAAAADATISAYVVFEPSAGAPLEPMSQVVVDLWRLDTSTGAYDWMDGGEVVSGAWTSPLVEEGTYAARFITEPFSGVGSEYYSDARYWVESTDFDVAAGASVDLGTIVLQPRYWDQERVAGVDRFHTAVEATQRLFSDDDSVPVIYLTNGYNFPDALAAGPAAGYQGGAILPVKTTSLPPVIAAELVRLQPDRVVVAGSEAAVSASVFTAVQKLLPAVAVVRLGGVDRFETAALIIEDAFLPYGSEHALIATGRNYPDALAAGAAAGYLGAPVVLVDGLRGSLPAAQTALLEALGVTEALIAGSGASVSAGIESDLVSLLGAGHVDRASGVDRYATANILNYMVFPVGDVAVVASGEKFPDALVGGPLAIGYGGPLYLTKAACFDYGAWLGMVELQTAGYFLMGGETTLSRKVENRVFC